MTLRVTGWMDELHRRYAGSPQGRKRLYAWMLYTGIFLFGIALAYGILLVTRRTIIWTYDSSAEYYPSMVYFSESLKRFFAGLARGEWIWPQYGFTIGLGEDVISSLNYYGFGDPLFLLTALAPRGMLEQAFVLMAFLRAYLAGLFFYGFIRGVGVSRGKALLGASAYALCGFSTFSLSVHQIFLNVLMYLPLILLGFEHLLRGKRPVLLPVATALLAFSGYYMLYMVSFFLVIYATFRFFREHPSGRGRIAAFFRLFVVTAGYYALGVALAGVTLLPSMWGFFQRAVTGRTVLDNLMFYSATGYAKELGKLLYIWNENLRAVAIWSFAAMLILVLRPGARRRCLGGAAGFCVLACLVVPFFGYMFNGFSFTTDRWSFMLSAVSAGALCLAFDELLTMKRREWLILMVVLAALFTGMIFVVRARVGGFGMRNLPYIAYAALATLATLGGMRLAQKAAGNSALPAGARRLIPLALCVVFVAGNLGLNGLVQNAIRIKNGAFLKAGTVDRLIESSPLAAVDVLKDVGYARVEVPMNEWSDRNEAMLLGAHGTACYLSVQNANTLDSISDLESISRTILHQVLGLDQREALMALMNVRFYAKRTDSPQQAPFGFTMTKNTGKVEVYENRNALPLGYSTTGVIAYADYQKMTGLERQQALLKGAVLRDAPRSTVLPETQIQSLSYAVSGMSDMEWTDNKVKTAKAPTMTLTFSAPVGSETYLRLTGAGFGGGSYQIVHVTGEGFEKKVLINGDNYVHAHGRDTYLVNLGYHEGALSEATLTFPANFNLRLGGIEVLSVPMDGFEASVDALREQSMTDVTVGIDRIEGKVTFDGERTLVIGIPYSEGWLAVVDGAPTPIDPSNGLTMALRLPAGEHRVVLTYQNPYQTAGTAASLIALAALALMWALGLKYRAGAGRGVAAKAPEA